MGVTTPQKIVSPSLWSPKRRASVTRGVKIAVYLILGYVLSIAAFGVVYFLTKQQVDDQVIQVVSGSVAVFAGMVHKEINWQSAGIDPSMIPTPSADGSLPPQIAQIVLPSSVSREGGDQSG